MEWLFIVSQGAKFYVELDIPGSSFKTHAGRQQDAPLHAATAAHFTAVWHRGSVLEIDNEVWDF